jgi:hypothetical protein
MPTWMPQWRFRVRKADIPPVERDLFERYGEQVIGLVLARGFTPAAPELQPLYQPPSPIQIHARDWLTQRSDEEEQHKTLTFWLELGVLVFVILGVIIDARLLYKCP